MKKPENMLVLCLILVLLFNPSVAWGQATSEPQPADVFQQIIQLVVENNPILESQRSFVNTIEEMPEPGAGFINLEELQSRSRRVGEEGVEIPLLSLSAVIQVETFVQRKLDREKTLAQAKQSYENLKASLISNLMAKVTEMAKLENKRENLQELKSFLETRRDSLEKQVKAGIQEPSALFDVTERVMQTSLGIKDAASELEILKLETAISLGGEKWEDLLDLLNQV
ncbi:hypothetical protein CEE34_10865 [Candidatus Aerophobetes bacterium Ae_b3a]|nr:MAG: hypothetical protein CEE34_10865 [Candidatus Aerophobetes bacterium Ae_b3a]